jgi:hypothetical protein
MSTRDIRVSDPVDALLVEQLLAMLHELRDACQTTPGNLRHAGDFRAC